MAIGAAIGLFLGPKSKFLEKDLYQLTIGGKEAGSKGAEKYPGTTLAKTIFASPDGESPLRLPTKSQLNLKIIDTQFSTEENIQPALPEWVKVSFKYSRRMALLDKQGVLAKAVGAERPGDKATAWLKISHQKLSGGKYVAYPQPVSSVGSTIVRYLSPIGALFMRLISMVIVPLVFASLVVGIASLGDVRRLGRLGGKTLATYIVTTALAVTIGLLVAHIVRPGEFVAEADVASLRSQFRADAGSRVDQAAEAPSMVDNLLHIVPENPVASMAEGNMLQIIFFALLFGIALTMLKESRSKQIVTFVDTVQQAMILIIHMVMAVAPFGVAALLAEVVGNSGWSILASLLVYAGTVVLGLLLQGGLVYGLLVRFVAKIDLGIFFRAARPAQLIAFSTSSSSATLPVTLECAEDNLGISKAVSSFVIPLGSTVNMDGTALYQGVAAVFIAQVFGVDLSLGAQLGIVFAATAASIGAAGVPGAGMITLAMVLTTAGIPIEGVALILGVDRILDMFRTSVNVTGDLAVTAAMAVLEGETLRPIDLQDDKEDPERGFESRLRNRAHPVNPDVTKTKNED